MQRKTSSYDVVVCGGGLAGLCAAVAAARQGAPTCLIQDRPVLGGCSSSEMRVAVHGAAAFHAYARETGLIGELLIEERHRNHKGIQENGFANSVWDMTMYDLALRTPNLTLHLNTTVTDVFLADGTRGSDLTATVEPSLALGYRHRPAINPSRRVAAVEARVANAETVLRVAGKVFIDCTGDGLLGDLAGCEWRWGSEGYEEFREAHAPAAASPDTMGNSIHFYCVDTGKPAPFVAPEWAKKYEDAAFFYDQGRIPHDRRGGYWWIEIGVPWNTIYDAEDIRRELTAHALGVWDWMKNRDPKMKDACRNYALDFIGQVPGKRENRRLLGRIFLNENDVAGRRVYPDEIAFGGWFLDLHTPGGLLAPTSEPAAAEGYKGDSDYANKSYMGPYGLPLGICVSKDLDNLLMAGRNVSTTHAALGTVRVMGTTALLGQACGVTAALATRAGVDPEAIRQQRIGDVQQILLRDGCFLPNYAGADPADLARQARFASSSRALNYGSTPQPSADPWQLNNRFTQWIAVDGGPLQRLSLCLNNSSGQEQQVQALLQSAESIWDYRADTDKVFARKQLQVPAGDLVWVDWELGLKGLPGVPQGGFVRLTLEPNLAVSWVPAEDLPGQVSAWRMGQGRMRRTRNGVTLAFRIDPAQDCYPPSMVASGESRPHRLTNAWRSDAAQPLPQWLDLIWEQPRTISQVELQFDGNIMREYHHTPTLWSDPATVADYRLLAEVDGGWQELCRVQGNYQRQRCHQFAQPVATRRLRVFVERSNGSPSAAIYEVRCY